MGSVYGETTAHTVKGKYGEPKHWDGLSALFIILLEREPDNASATERDWLKQLKAPSLQLCHRGFDEEPRLK